MSHRTLTLADLDLRSAYELLTSAVQPRPIAFVSTLDPEGRPNLAPFSFFMAGGSHPPSVAFSPVLGSQGQEKDTLRNVRATGEFVLNAVDASMADGMNATSFGFRPEESEWDVAGFTPKPSTVVAPPRVGESLLSLECRLHTVVAHGDGPGAARYVIGEALVVHVREDLLVDGAVDHARIRLLGRMGGPDYIDTAAPSVFGLDRPK